MKDETIEKVAEWLYRNYGAKSLWKGVCDDIKEVYRNDANALLSVIQPDGDVLAEIREHAKNCLEWRGKVGDMDLHALDTIVYLCTPQEQQPTMRDEIRQIISEAFAKAWLDCSIKGRSNYIQEYFDEQTDLIMSVIRERGGNE